MATTQAPDVAPILASARESSKKGRPGKTNPVYYVILAAIVILMGVGFWRMFAQPAPQAVKARVVAAGINLPAGVRLGYRNLRYTEIPQDYVTEGMITSTKDLVGFTTRNFVTQGEPVLKSDLIPDKNGLSLAFDTSLRAMTLKISDEGLVDHSIHPGDRVDVLVTSTQEGKKFTKTICQAVPVLMAVPRAALLDRRSSNNQTNKVTLGVTPEQSEKLLQATETGKIHLVLRNRLSTELVNLSGASASDILPPGAEKRIASNSFSPAQNLALPPPPPSIDPPADQPSMNPVNWVVEVFSGSQKVTREVPQY